MNEYQKTPYIWRHKHIQFNSAASPETPQRRVGEELDRFDLVFKTKESFDKWYADTVVTLARLDKPLNYCAYFVRDRGNEGWYEREGKRCRVNGEWDGDHLHCSHAEDKGFVCCQMRDFRKFLEQNGWLSDWWELHRRYKKVI